MTWFILLSTGGVRVYAWGLNGDTYLCGDYDLDGKSDVTVWRKGAPGVAAFYVLRSSDATVLVEPFGQTGDDARVVGDYNGDGRDDFAVHRSGANSGDQAFLFYRTTPGGAVAYVPWGLNGDFSTPFDHDGDGSMDPAVQRNGGGGQADFWIRQSSNGATVLRRFGTPTDVVVAGYYDDDATEDITVARPSAGQYQWWTLGTASDVITLRTFGASATDFHTTGDWDGDGRTDIGIWRSDPSVPGQFWTLGSTAGVKVVEWGKNGDFPVNSWRRK
jgi:hypothetical protein